MPGSTKSVPTGAVYVAEVVDDEHVLLRRDVWQAALAELDRLRGREQKRKLRRAKRAKEKKREPRRFTLAGVRLPTVSKYKGAPRAVRYEGAFKEQARDHPDTIQQRIVACIRKLCNNESLNALNVKPMRPAENPTKYTKQGQAFWAWASQKWRVGFVVETDTLRFVAFVSAGDRRHGIEA
jgi:hypothetical protein